MKVNFREWTLDQIDEAFGTTQVDTLPRLDEWMDFQYALNDYETTYLSHLRATYNIGGDDWNEVELENKIISPMFVFADFDNRKYAYFLERELVAKIGEYEVSGKVDGMIASGFRNPKQPFFCLNEYKRATDPNGDPKGQVLIAMLAAQSHNTHFNYVYGCFIVGKLWHFLVLEGKEYAIGTALTCDGDEIFDIFRKLKGLKSNIERLFLPSL
jgi:hypothetical protein